MATIQRRIPWAAAFCLMIPVFWLGLLVAISGIEAPLKFTAPGITIPLGLGIGRRVFLALNIVEVICCAGLWVAMRRAPAPARFQQLVRVLTVVLAVQVLVIRFFLNRRTTQVIAGTADEGSIWHWLYMGAEVIVGLLLLALILQALRRWLRT